MYHCFIHLAQLAFAACNHPSLIDKDYRKDASAIESKPAQRTEEEEENKEVEELADLFGAVDLAGGKTCAVCQVRFVRYSLC